MVLLKYIKYDVGISHIRCWVWVRLEPIPNTMVGMGALLEYLKYDGCYGCAVGISQNRARCLGVRCWNISNTMVVMGALLEYLKYDGGGTVCALRLSQMRLLLLIMDIYE